MAGDYRVNMRIFEAMGCGAHMLSDGGIYPDGLNEGEHFSIYKDVADLEKKILNLLKNPQVREQIANNGAASIRANYSKEHQWECFQQIIGGIS
jgi:spore maturation protein CgeB